jgi:DNA-directed RNA polymerase specialized sigma24 family protein
VNQEELEGLVASGVLTRKEAEAIWLHDVKGLSYQEIGLALRKARQTIHERRRRGHEKILRARKEAA